MNGKWEWGIGNWLQVIAAAIPRWLLGRSISGGNLQADCRSRYVNPFVERNGDLIARRSRLPTILIFAHGPPSGAISREESGAPEAPK
jgi:hypothetical protein